MSDSHAALSAAQFIEEKVRGRLEGQEATATSTRSGSAPAEASRSHREQEPDSSAAAGSGSRSMPPVEDSITDAPPPYTAPLPGSAAAKRVSGNASSRSSSPYNPDWSRSRHRRHRRRRSRDSLTYTDYLYAIDRFWHTKTALRVLIILCNVAAIACIIVVALDPVKWTRGRMWYSVEEYFADSSLALCIIPLAMSTVWTAIALFVHFMRRPPTPIHPGITMIFEFIMVCATIGGLARGFQIANTRSEFNIRYVDDYGGIGDTYYYGSYIQASNGTWSFYIKSAYSYYSTLQYRDLPTPPLPDNTLAVASTATTPTTSADWSSIVVPPTTAVEASSPTVAEAKRTPEPAVDSSASVSQTSALQAFATDASSSSTSSSTTTTRSPFLLTTITKAYTTRVSTISSSLVRTSLPVSQITRDCKPFFDPCADQDLFINQMMQHNPKRTTFGMTAPILTVCSFLLHLALLIWAFVDLRCGKEARHARRELQQGTDMDILQPGRTGGYRTVNDN